MKSHTGQSLFPRLSIQSKQAAVIFSKYIFACTINLFRNHTFPFKPVTKESRVGAYLCFVLTLHKQRITCPHEKICFKAGLGSGSQKTHPHFIWCFIFFLREPFLKDAGSLQADNHTSQVHIKGLYLCWGKNRPRNRQRDSTAKHNLCPPSSLILKAGGNNSSWAQSLDHTGPLALAGGQLGQCYVILAKTMPRSHQWSCHTPLPMPMSASWDIA